MLRAGLRLWLDEAAVHITERAGGERAGVFLGKVAAVLPPGFPAGARQAG